MMKKKNPVAFVACNHTSSSESRKRADDVREHIQQGIPFWIIQLIFLIVFDFKIWFKQNLGDLVKFRMLYLY